MALAETATIAIMAAALIGGGAYLPTDIAGAVAKAREIHKEVFGY